MIKPLLLITLAALTGCTDTTVVKHSLNGRGYSDVQLTGYTFAQCGIAVGFRATKDGQTIDGHVCSEWRTKVNSVKEADENART
jgi:hypothetical protein